MKGGAMRQFGLALGLMCAVVLGLGATLAPSAAYAQEQTLADIRAELAQLAGSIAALRAEMLTSGEATMPAQGGSALDRMDAIEAELVRLTGRTEALGNRINTVAADGTKRVKNLEFRLCELEEGCDVSNLPISTELGGPVTAPQSTGTDPVGTPKLAGSEQADFDRAKSALDQGDAEGAEQMFASFAKAYTGGPLTGEAHYLRGEALVQLGRHADAAREYLETFSAAPDGPRAADSLLRLGQSLGTLGQAQEACLTLAEVPSRFPSAPAALEAASSMRNLGCQ